MIPTCFNVASRPCGTASTLHSPTRCQQVCCTSLVEVLTDVDRVETVPLQHPTLAHLRDRAAAGVSFGIKEFEWADHGLVYVFAVDGDDHGDRAVGGERLFELVANSKLLV
jgi:hypothetical protein